jgi:hypothetical protein
VCVYACVFVHVRMRECVLSYLFVNDQNRCYGTCYVYEGTRAHISGIVLKSLPSIMPALQPFLFLGKSLNIAPMPIQFFMRLCMYIMPHYAFSVEYFVNRCVTDVFLEHQYQFSWNFAVYIMSNEMLKYPNLLSWDLVFVSCCLRQSRCHTSYTVSVSITKTAASQIVKVIHEGLNQSSWTTPSKTILMM